MNCKIAKKAAKLLVPAALAAIPVALLAPGRCSPSRKAPFIGRNYAHRGLHAQDKSVPENSLTAFKLAAQAGYGAELDVQLSKDGRVVVFHDDDLLRVCGVDKRVDELTFAELQELRLCGTDEKIPLFTDVLAAFEGGGPLIVELKNGRRNKELCRKTRDTLKSFRGEYCIESFNPMIVAWFRFHAPEVVRGQLAMPEENYKMGKATDFILANCLLNFAARPNFIAYKIGKRPLSVRFSELLGAIRVGWTSREEGNENGRDAVIFEFYKPELTFKN